MTPIPLFVELCAGTAALSLRLHKAKARPPVSRMGSKAGYAEPILRALGLAPGQGAERYLWAEADPGVRLLLAAYTDRALAQGAAEVIRGWAGEEPRALWERLRAEGPTKGGPAVDAREVARWAHMQAMSLYGGGTSFGGWFRAQAPAAQEWHGPDRCKYFAQTYGVDNRGWPLVPIAGHPGVLVPRLDALPTLPGVVAPDVGAVDPYEVARWLRIATSNRLINVGPDWKNTGAGGSTFGGAEFCTAIDDLLRAVEGVEEVPGVVTGRASVDPRDVARWLTVQAGSLGGIHGQGPTDFSRFGHNPKTGERFAGNPAVSVTLPTLDALPIIPGIVTDRADFDPPRLPAGTVVIIDPPYVNTTPYGHDLPRAEVVRVARAWREAGARVGVCEQEPIADLVGDGWAFVDIADLRVGQKRTFSKQQREVVTLSEPAPVGWATGGQVGLFPGAR